MSGMAKRKDNLEVITQEQREKLEEPIRIGIEGNVHPAPPAPFRFDAVSLHTTVPRRTHPFDTQSRSIDVLNHSHRYAWCSFLLCCLGSYPMISYHDFRATVARQPVAR